MEPLLISDEKDFFDTSRYASINLKSTFNLASCSNADILESFTESRKRWISSLFDRVSTSKTPHTSLGSCTIMIGPHVFPNSQFYKTHAKLGLLTSHTLEDYSHSSLKNITQISTPPTSPISPSKDKFDIVFELEDSPGSWWLLPKDVKLKTQSLKEPYQVSVTFPPLLAKSLPDPIYQQTNQNFFYIFGVQKELWAELQLALIDFYINDEYETHYTRPKIILKHPKNSKISHDSYENYYNLSQSDSDQYDSDFVNDTWGSSPCARKYQKVSSGVADKTPTKVLITPKRINLSVTSNSGGMGKKCGYCGCKSTPMWRRGPAGPGTLCNACGVKWKHGKILQEQPVKYEKLVLSSRGRASSSKDLSCKMTPVVLINSRMTRDNTPVSSMGDDDGINE
ncbi:hypothetical protein K7432_001984 [Basidiobolus ranarum]|uniref:GATA-type domain-containing protein n=1 Tax=Basidiobolus ranarum TaxID=34480 RepID=A0ABR2W8L3_9FUNG